MIADNADCVRDVERGETCAPAQAGRMTPGSGGEKSPPARSASSWRAKRLQESPIPIARTIL